MPTISQLPAVDEITAADAIPVNQQGVTHSVTVGTLLASVQPAVISDTGTLLGRISLGAGGPEPVTVGSGLVLSAGTLSATGSGETSDSSGITSIDSLPRATMVAANDLVAISQGGVDHTISYTNFLNGLTIDLAQPASPTGDADTLWVAQGSSTMLRQSFAGIWSWLMSKQPSYKLPVVEITTNTTLDGTVHNGRILICSQPITLSPAAQNMGSGFHCDVLNLSAGDVTFGVGVTTSSGILSLPSGQSAALRVVSYSGGTVVFASLPGSTTGNAPPAVPGQVTGLSAGSPTASSVNLTWAAPNTGGSVTSYTVQYRITGTTTWSTFSTGLVTTNALVAGLVAASGYDFQVYAVNGGGAGQPSSSASASTSAAATGAVTSITWNMVPSGSYVHGAGSIGVNAHINPAAAPVQFGFSTSSTVPPIVWVVATYVNTDLWGSYVSTPGSAGSWYAWVEGTDGSAPTVYPTPFTVT